MAATIGFMVFWICEGDWNDAMRLGRTRKQEQAHAELFARACALWDGGELRKAFDIFLAAAKEGDPSSQINAGVFYSEGLGVRRNDARALYWYRRAYGHGGGDAAAAANNIGILHRDRGNLDRALFWLERALSLGDDGSALEIAKIHLGKRKSVKRGLEYLQRLARSRSISEATEEQARELLETYRSSGGGAQRIH